MKKVFVYLLVALLLLHAVPVYAEQDAQTASQQGQEAIQPVYDYDELVVGSATPFSGAFFTQMWGNVTSDLDVRMLIHGYNLVEWNSAVGAFAIDPSVVSGIVVTENGDGDRTYTLTIYDDLYYSDGSAITAWDYAFSMLLNIAPQVAEIGGNVRAMQYVNGYGEYITGQAPYLAGVRVISDRTMSVTISHEYLPFFYELGLLDCVPYPIDVVAPGCRVRDEGSGVYIANADENAVQPAFTAELLRETILDETSGYRSHPTVTSGPYRLLSYDGKQVELEINEYYKGNSDGVRPTIKRLIYKTVAHDEMMDLLASGQVGLLNKCVSADILQAGLELRSRNSLFAADNYMRSGLGYITFCCERATVSDAAVRQAISLCMDKDALIADTVGNFGLRVDGYYGIGQWMYQLVSGGMAYPVAEPEENATAAEKRDYEEEMAAWEKVTLEDIPVYQLDPDAALELLIADGWTLNRQGEAFDPQRDDVRCKQVGDEVVPLALTMLCPAENGMEEKLKNAFSSLEAVGISLTVESLPMTEVLKSYYRTEERSCDMIFMATNFDIVFDPSNSFRPDGDTPNPYNAAAISDETLYRLAVDMRQTQPENVREYCEKWVRFEARFQEVAPMIPLYSNVYFDFYARVLQNYHIESNISWGNAVVEAFMSDIPDAEEETEDTVIK